MYTVSGVGLKDNYSVNVSILRASGEPDWQAYINSHPDASIYHTLEWRDILYNEYRFEPMYLMAIERDRVVGVLPMFLVNNLSGKKLISLPFSIYGGALFNSSDIFSALMNKAKLLMVETKAEYIQLRCFSRLEKELVEDAGLCDSNTYLNFMVKLEKGPESIWDGLKNRKEIRKAERAGLSVVVTDDVESLGEFYQLQLITRKRHGLPTPSLNYYKTFFVHDFSKIVLVKKCDKTISSGIFFSFKGKLIYVLGASDMSYQQYRPNDLMIWNIIKWGCDRGFKELDLGPTFFEEKGVLQFKEKWAGEKKIVKRYIFPPQMGPIVSGKSSKIFRLMPINIAKMIGPVVVRLFG